MAVKRKSLGQDAKVKKVGSVSSCMLPALTIQAKTAPAELDTDDEIEQYAAQSTLVDPMIDVQASDDSDDDDEEDAEMPSDDGDDDDGVEEFTGFDEEVEEPAPAAGPSRTKSLYKAPTLAELDELRAAEASGGNTFSLQLDALLSSTLLPSTPSAQLKGLLGAVHDLVHALPSLPALSPPKAVARLAKGSQKGKAEAVPFPPGLELDLAEVQWKLGFEPPAEVFVGGSWAVCGGYKKGKGEAGGVDVVVVIPQVGYRMIEQELTPRPCFQQRTAQRTATSTSARTTSL